MDRTRLRQIIKEELGRAVNETNLYNKYGEYRKDPEQVMNDYRYVKPPGSWARVRRGFQRLAAGEGEEWWREENYPGWTDADFQEVVDTLDRELGTGRALSQRD